MLFLQHFRLLLHLLWPFLRLSLLFGWQVILFWGRGFTFFHSTSGAFSVAATVGTAFVAVDVVAFIAGRGEFLAEHALAMCSNAPQDQQYDLRSSTTTNICLSRHTNIFEISPKACRFSVTCNTMSPKLHMLEDTSIGPYLGNKTPIRSSDISTGTPCTVIFVHQVPMYSVWSHKAVVVMILPASCFASFSVARRRYHIALDLLAKYLIHRFFKVYSMVSLQIPINFRLLMSVVNREINHCTNCIQGFRYHQELISLDELFVFDLLFFVIHRVLLWPVLRLGSLFWMVIYFVLTPPARPSFWTWCYRTTTAKQIKLRLL